MESMDIQVVKRDGSIEAYSESKISKVGEAAGLNQSQAQTLASSITAWLTEQKVKKVTSLDIRDQVISGLKKLNTYAANLFIWYEKTKTAH